MNSAGNPMWPLMSQGYMFDAKTQRITARGGTLFNPYASTEDRIKAALRKSAEIYSDPEGWSLAVHASLDAAGMLPGVGEFADAAQAVLFFAEGDYQSAALAGAAIAIPLVSSGVLTSAGKAAGKFITKGGKAAVVIGENMNRVRSIANSLEASTYKGLSIRNFNPNNPKHVARSMNHNRAWVLKMMRQGRTIIDVGPDFARRAEGVKPSIYYGMERETTKSYSGYVKAWMRTGKGSGHLLLNVAD